MTRLKYILHVILYMLIVAAANAQQQQPQQRQQEQPQESAYDAKKTRREVRANLKADKFTQAEDIINKAMKTWAEARSDMELNSMMLTTQHALADAENRKIFLNNRPDTAKYFSYIYNVYKYGIVLDSLDRLPDTKGRVRPRYTSSIASNLQSYRNNIKSAGKFFYKKKNYKEAYKYFDIFMQTMHQPALESLKNYRPDADSIEVALLAVYSAYAATDYPSVVKYLPVALNDSSEFSYLCQIGSHTYMEMKDTLNAVDYLFEGWKANPQSEYFFVTLVDYYINRQDYADAYNIVSAQLIEDPDNHRLWYIFGKCQQCMDSIDAAIISYEHALAIQPKDALSYSSLGSIYIDKARQAYNVNNYTIGTAEYARAKTEQDRYYERARGYLEKARQFSPEDTALWLTPLSEVYYKLNMGKELKALESLETNGSAPKSGESNNSASQSRGDNNSASQRGSNNPASQRGSNNSASRLRE